MTVIDYSKIKILACATVIEEMMPLIPSGMEYQTLDFGLHTNPETLKDTLQAAIDSIAGNIDTIILGYGLCSQAVVGLKSEKCRLVIPKVDDCIAIFLGSDAEYRKQHQIVPGTYYLTKGWIESASSPFDEYEGMVNKYGEVRARRLMGKILKNYKRLAFINTGKSADLAKYHDHSKMIADKFELQYEELQGSDYLIKKMLYGPWDDNFITVRQGDSVQFIDFKNKDNS